MTTMSKFIEYNDLSVQVYRRVKGMIINNELKPGEKILQEKLAHDLGVSRMPLHKAFQRLENELLVENIPRRGIFVRKINIPDIIDAFECRAGLEAMAARRAVMNAEAKDIQKLETIIRPYSEGNKFDHVDYLKLDQNFHETIIHFSQNHLLKHLNEIGNVLIRSFLKGIILPIEESDYDHRKIIEAFKEKDAEKAASLIQNHSLKARNMLQENFRREKANLISEKYT